MAANDQDSRVIFMPKKPTPVFPAKTLLAEIGSSLDATSFFNGLELAGVVARVEYMSTTGSGEVKQFVKIEDGHLNVGQNKKTMHEFKTEARFFRDGFESLAVVSCRALLENAISIERGGKSE
jgi:hypothetical protein